MENSENKINTKRLKLSFLAVVALAALAVVIQLLVMVLPPSNVFGNGKVVSVQYIGRTNTVATSNENANANANANAPTSAPVAGVSADASTPAVGSARLPMGKGGVSAAASQQPSPRAEALGNVVLDGAPMGIERAVSIDNDNREFTQRIGFIDQYETLPSGCEIVALCVALQSMGYDANPEDVADNYVNMSEGLPVGYSGSPYSDGGALPPCIADAAEGWLADHGRFHRAYDSTGTPFESMMALVECGYPVLAWVTEGMTQPSGKTEYGTANWYFPEHCVVVYGAQGDNVLVSDSIEGLVEIDRQEFADIYHECGDMSVVVLSA